MREKGRAAFGTAGGTGKSLSDLCDARREINGSVFHCYYSLTDDTDSASWTEVRAEFTPSDHTWVGAKIGLFANVIGEKELGGYGDFEYLHVEALED